MENDFFRIVGLFLIFAMVGLYYRDSLKTIFATPKESFLLTLPIVFLGVLFYFFFKSKGF
jgi:predicted RND superfamily exporter protein